jgi:hypothetical protein
MAEVTVGGVAVESGSEADKTTRAMQGWLDQMPPGLASVKEEVVGSGTRVRIAPTKPGRMDFVVAFSSDDAIDLYWGDGFQAEQIKADPDFLLQVCEAVRRGKVTVERWRFQARPCK